MSSSSHPVAKINLGELLDGSRVGPLQIRVFALCMACLIMDGVDIQALGYTAPEILKEWGLANSMMGPVFSAGNFGVLVGSLVFSAVGDKIGRRPVLIGATIFFSVMTILTGLAQNVNQLLWLRLIGGIGMGCIMPNATALIGEYSPRSKRVTFMMCITVGFTIGAALGGLISAFLIPRWGWRSVFYFGGAVPLVIGALMYVSLPESMQFLAVRRRLDKVGRWLKELDPTIRIDQNTEFVVNEETRGGMPFLHLFREGRTVATVLLWVVNFMNLLILYSLSNWLPTVVTGMGYTAQTARLVATGLQIGGTIGTFGLAWMIAKKGFMPTLITTFAIATFSVGLIGQPGLSLAVLSVIVFVAGWCIIGGQPGINALSATYYPTYLRSTGIGWALGIGRIGAIVGPYLGGALMARQWGPQELFLAAAVPAAVSTVTMVVLKMTMRLPAPAPRTVSATH